MNDLCVCVCVYSDVVDDGGALALCSLWISYQIIPGTENTPTEGEVLIRGTGQTQAGVLCHPIKKTVFELHVPHTRMCLWFQGLLSQQNDETVGKDSHPNQEVSERQSVPGAANFSHPAVVTVE